MDCSLIAVELIAYHFGTVADAEREAIEDHLLGCTECLRAYLRLKRDVERGGASGARPSAAAKKRLRDDVQATFAPQAARPRRWLRRSIPLYQGLAAAAVAAAVALLLPRFVRAPSSRPPASRAVVDTSRTEPESLSIY